MAWTDERIERMKRDWADGLSASQIAARLGGTTRNAVVGKLHRIGAAGLRNPSRKKPQIRRRPTLKQRQAFGSIVRTPAQLLAERMKHHPIPDPQPEDIARVSFLDLEETHCKFIVGEPKGPFDPQFCGDQREAGLPYCATHAMRCYGHTPERAAVKVRPGPILTRAAGTKVFDYA